MEPLSFFSPQELQAWADQRLVSNLLSFTWIGLRLTFLVVVVWTGLHLALRRSCERGGDWLAEHLGFLGRRLPGLRRVGAAFARLSGRPGSGWLVDAAYPGVLLLLWALLVLPLSFFDSYVLEHERALATISLGRWWSDWGKSIGLGLCFSAFLGLGLFGLARRLPRTWWLWLWGAVVGLLVVWSMLSPLRQQIYNRFTPLPEGELRRSIGHLVESAGFDLERVEVIDTSTRSRRAGAFVMGEGPTRKVVLGDNLVRDFHPREIAVAVGHEMGHQLHAHPVRSWLTTALAALLFLGLVQLVLRIGPRFRRLGLRPDADPAVLPLLLLVLQLVFMLNDPLSGWLDRAEERQADEEALRLTSDPVAYCSLMVRLARLNQADVDPPVWVRLLAAHPPVIERLRFGLDWARRAGIAIGPGAIPLPVPAPRSNAPPTPAATGGLTP